MSFIKPPPPTTSNTVVVSLILGWGLALKSTPELRRNHPVLLLNHCKSEGVRVCLLTICSRWLI
jgi:hypothetical protein